ncbi:MAG: NnrS family protein [Bacteriovoracaceae bacterium]|nr:NnrS family protein [Bacteriovoracaceae bacterium]
MNNQNVKNIYNEPYRLMFPLGTLYLLWGIFLWIPQLWSQESYPITLHRTLVLNGFMAMFVGGFLMTAVPKFSRTHAATKGETLSYVVATLIIIGLAFLITEPILLSLSSIQAFLIFIFAFRRFRLTKASPPFTFVFIFVGFLLWILAGIPGNLFSQIPQVSLQYDGAILAFILGIGSKLIPGILGHSEILPPHQSSLKKITLFSSIPKYFYLLMLLFASSFLLDVQYGNWLRFFIVLFMSMRFWKIYLLPPIKTSLTICIWISSWLILLSVFLKAIWIEGFIHAGHSFFINGIVLLSILVATRVLVAHGPMKKELENSKWIYAVAFFIVLAAATRVSAYLMPDTYYRHLAYSSFSLGIGLILWSIRYLKFVRIFPMEIKVNG